MLSRAIFLLKKPDCGYKPYLKAVDNAFKGDIDYAQLVKLYGEGGGEPEKKYSPAEGIGSKKAKSYYEEANAEIHQTYKCF